MKELKNAGGCDNYWKERLEKDAEDQETKFVESRKQETASPISKIRVYPRPRQEPTVKIDPWAEIPGQVQKWQQLPGTGGRGQVPRRLDFHGK